MELTLQTDQRPEFIVVELGGRLVMGAECNALDTLVTRLLDAGHARIILNLAEVQYVDSFGIGRLVALHTQARQRGSHAKLVDPAGRLRQLLAIAKLVGVLPTYPTVEAAAGSFTVKT